MTSVQLHDPYMAATPLQKSAVKEHRLRMERMSGLVKRALPDPVTAVLPPIPNEEIRKACEGADYIPVILGQVESIQRAVLTFYPSVTMREMLSDRRTAAIALPRMIAMYLCRELTPRSFPDIGRRFGGRDHSTVMHAANKISRLIKSGDEFAKHILEIRSSVLEVV